MRPATLVKSGIAVLLMLALLACAVAFIILALPALIELCLAWINPPPERE